MSLVSAVLAREVERDLSTPDPDEVDAPCVCDVCHAQVDPFIRQVCTKKTLKPRMPENARERLPLGARYHNARKRDMSRPVVCSDCRKKGWRGSWCSCGAVMHKRDFAYGSRKVGACGTCRKEMNEKRSAF